MNGQYALYTRPQDSFIEAGKGGGIGFALCETIERAEIGDETIVDAKVYHTIKEVKNGAGAPPLKTAKGWLHVAHGVRNTAAGLRYVLYALPVRPRGPLEGHRAARGLLPRARGEERVGDVSNVAFCNGAVMRATGEVFIYYASSDTRMHVATTTVDRLLDYVLTPPEDPLRSAACVAQRDRAHRPQPEAARPHEGQGVPGPALGPVVRRSLGRHSEELRLAGRRGIRRRRRGDCGFLGTRPHRVPRSDSRSVIE